MAIQISGTQVIGNSRELTNIASVDATTVAAFGTAGVGGGWEQLQETSISSQVSYIQYNFASGYREFLINLRGLRSVSTSRELYARLTDTSNNLISTGSNYASYEVQNDQNYTAAFFRTWGSFRDNLDFQRADFWFHIRDPKYSNRRTSMETSGMGNRYAAATGFRSICQYRATEAHNGIRFFPNAGSFGSTTEGYTVWGAK